VPAWRSSSRPLAGSSTTCSSRGLRFDHLEVLVLDEPIACSTWILADIKRILAALPQKRQSLLFSATIPAPIAELSRKLLQDPVRIDVERPSAPPSLITQSVLPVAEQLKPLLLVELLRRGDVCTALVFTAPSTARTGSPTSWRGPASPATASTATAASASGRRPSPTSRTAASRCWSRPTSRPAASMFTSCRTS